MILEESFQESKSVRFFKKRIWRGLYTTPNIDYAIEYAGRNGTLLIFDWTNPDRNLKIKHLNDLEE
jgi:hypothetical protein